VAGRQKSNFGQLLENYLGDLGVTQTELERRLDYGTGVVSKYKYVRSPPPEFIYKASRYLGLNEERTFALVYAVAADLSLGFLKAYIEFSKSEGTRG